MKPPEKHLPIWSGSCPDRGGCMRYPPDPHIRPEPALKIRRAAPGLGGAVLNGSRWSDDGRHYIQLSHGERTSRMVDILRFLIISTFLLAGVQASAGRVPRQIAGIVLGGSIEKYKETVRIDTALPIRHMEYLTEVEMKPQEGFRSGYITYANCENPGQIVKIRLKYAREEKEFYEELLKRYNKQLGESSMYRGDPFRVFVAWKWSFTDEEGARISITLQHNSMEDEDYPRGTTVKMALISAIERERLCFEKTRKETGRDEDGVLQERRMGLVDFRNLVPE